MTDSSPVPPSLTVTTGQAEVLLDELLDFVDESGGTVTITREGLAIALMEPPPDEGQAGEPAPDRIVRRKTRSP